MRKWTFAPDEGFVMTRVFRRFAAVFLASFGICLPVSATIHSIDFTDIWWIPAESGWGLNLIQQGSVLFGTLFVYGTDRSPRWYVASALVAQSSIAGTYMFKSPLYRTTGTPFATVPFDPTSVALDQVGEMTVTFGSPTSGQLVYNVGSETITKSIQRQAFRSDSPVGTYAGGLAVILSACTNPNANGRGEILGSLTATVAGNAATFRIDYSFNGFPAACTFNGTLAQQGKLAQVTNGAWGCAVGGGQPTQGAFTISSLDIQVNGMHGTFVGTDQFCTYNGRFGGLRDVIN